MAKSLLEIEQENLQVLLTCIFIIFYNALDLMMSPPQLRIHLCPSRYRTVHRTLIEHSYLEEIKQFMKLDGQN